MIFSCFSSKFLSLDRNCPFFDFIIIIKTPFLFFIILKHRDTESVSSFHFFFPCQVIFQSIIDSFFDGND